MDIRRLRSASGWTIAAFDTRAVVTGVPGLARPQAPPRLPGFVGATLREGAGAVAAGPALAYEARHRPAGVPVPSGAGQ
jgi:hypothetical protein